VTEAPANLSVLSLEDDDFDAELVEGRLSADGLVGSFRRAKDEQTFLAELDRGGIDVVLSDFSMPGYDGWGALSAAQQRAPEVPFIFVSGAIGEDRALETLRRGATDYVLKDRLERLPPAVVRAVAAARERRMRRDAEAERDRLLVSERQARESAEAANRMKDEFLAVVSHELRTPLNAILGWATLLSGGPKDEATLTRGLATIERNARVQSRLIEDILDISRVVTGKLQLRVAKVAVSSFVAAAVEAVRPAATAKGVSLEVQADAGGEVTGDADRLQQVVWNLLSNAVKFTPKGGVVSLFVQRTGDAVDIVVRDSGLGIERSFLPFVFERFRQADGTATRRHGGLGLGLAIVRHLVELHGGTASVESAGLGHGSTFRIRIPGVAVTTSSVDTSGASTDAGDVTPSRPRGAEPEAPSLRGVRVLLVEDEADTRELVSFVLESNGAQVTAAASVLEALHRLKDARPTVIVSDIGMPHVDGYSFVRRVRALPADAGGRTPAIALTAYARDLDKKEAEAAGYQRHLAKPVSPSLLVATVAEVARGIAT
jgi:signal transduction histidine kinase